MITKRATFFVGIVALGAMGCESGDGLSRVVEEVQADSFQNAPSKNDRVAVPEQGLDSRGSDDEELTCGAADTFDLLPEVFELELEGASMIGASQAAATMVVFFDYQCPFCKRTAREIDNIIAEYGDDVQVLYVHAPLPMHPSAELAALAAMAADQQGRFEAMHESLVDYRGPFDREAVVGLAEQAGLDVRAFEQSLDDPQLYDRLTTQKEAAAVMGARGRPTTFVNGRRVEGNHPTKYREAIDLSIMEVEGC